MELPTPAAKVPAALARFHEAPPAPPARDPDDVEEEEAEADDVEWISPVRRKALGTVAAMARALGFTTVTVRSDGTVAFEGQIRVEGSA